MNSFPFPKRGTIPSKNNNQQQEQKQQNGQQTKLSAKTRKEQYQANKEAGLKCSIHHIHGHNDEQCFTQAKQAQTNTIQEEDKQEQITNPFRLIGLTDMQGNLLQAMKDSGTGPSLVRASAVLNA